MLDLVARRCTRGADSGRVWCRGASHSGLSAKGEIPTRARDRAGVGYASARARGHRDDGGRGARAADTRAAARGANVASSRAPPSPTPRQRTGRCSGDYVIITSRRARCRRSTAPRARMARHRGSSQPGEYVLHLEWLLRQQAANRRAERPVTLRFWHRRARLGLYRAGCARCPASGDASRVARSPRGAGLPALLRSVRRH